MTMTPKMQPFTFETQPVRVEMLDGQPWFVLADVCKVLEIKNPRNVAARLDEDEKDGVRLMDGIGREQEFTVVNESGLYAVILRSDKPQAKTFRKWVTSEVLPAIRQTGSYVAQASEPSTTLAADPLELLNLSVQALQQQRAQIGQLALKTSSIEQRLETLPITGLQKGQIHKTVGELARLLGGKPHHFQKAWRDFKDRFGLAAYGDLPANRFDEAMSFLRKLIEAYQAGTDLGMSTD